MSNEDVIKKFLTCYQNHDFSGMNDCLDENVTFSDFACDIQGNKVRAMWHWFCGPYKERKDPVEVPEFEVGISEGGIVSAKYRVKYLYGSKKKCIDYFINSKFRVQNGKILEQQDSFGSISQYQFAQRLLGFPGKLIGVTPLFRIVVRKKFAKTLSEFMKDYGY